MSQRMTLGYLGNHYGLAVQPKFCEPVTITSLADDARSVRPGALFVPSQNRVSAAEIVEAQTRGAYAMVLPQAKETVANNIQIPLLLGTLDAEQIGQLASDVAGEPSEALAIFAIADSDGAKYVNKLAEFLHILGNPVGVVSSEGSYSLDRPLELNYPISMFDMERLMSVCLEDGAAALVIAVNPQTLKPHALQAVQVDVVSLASSSSALAQISAQAREAADEAARKADKQANIKAVSEADVTQTVAIASDEMKINKDEQQDKRRDSSFDMSRNQTRQAEQRRLEQICTTYGLRIAKNTKVAARTDESDSLSMQAGISEDGDSQKQLSLSISMTMAAGVRRNNIKSALRVSKELS
ncbi:UDP-N-acetylmuramyl peptide synthase [Bifidobacterium aquikefiri]|uniref:UDP-N-acetylmuramyl peptide synthase n=1 Tax=Bifidobacterium aquikefiri TaxID=1653207 RepID=UPI0039E84CC8